MGASWSFFLCGELMTIRAWKCGSAGTIISINCLGASGLSYCGYPKRSVPGAIFWRNILLSSIFIPILWINIFCPLLYNNIAEFVLILANFSVKTKNC